MSFSAEWLDLRKAADSRARNRNLQAKLVAALPDRPLRVLDLGAGSGANLAALAPLLARPQHWTLVDNDAALLDIVALPGGIVVEKKVANLRGGMMDLFHPAPDLITASAFFDLCGAAVLNRVIKATQAVGAIFYTVLTYDGRETWSPPHDADPAVLTAFRADQCRDKGLGPALGPDATNELARGFRAAGYTVSTAASDWVLQKDRDLDLIKALAAGSAAAVSPTLGPLAEDWSLARADADRAVIGHQDLLALPPERRA